MSELGTGPKQIAALVALVGLFLLLTGPAFAVVVLFMSIDAPVQAEGTLAAAHMLGLIAGLVGVLLLLGGCAWWVAAALARRRSESRDAA